MKRKYAMVINTVAIVSRIGTDGRAYSSDKLFIEEVEVLEIIGYPVADGSAEWALYQMMQGKKVTFGSDDGRFYALSTLEDGSIGCYFGKITDNSCHENGEDFVAIHTHGGWQLYEPEPAKEQFAVGDWVEIEVAGVISQQRVRTGVFSDRINAGGFEFYSNGLPVMEPLNARITRKLDPTEVVIHIGCLSGTVTYAISDDCFLLAKVNDPQHRACCIDMSMLDTATRELVESLLKAQEEK